MTVLLETAKEAARLGGQVLLDWRDRFTISEKGQRDFVTQADLESEKVIREYIAERFPEHSFLGEETKMHVGDNSEYCWIVDPLDGTTNYIHQLPSYSVSIGLRKGNEIIAGVVLDPLLGECFYASKDGGAFLNEQPIQVSGIAKLNRALLVVSLSASIQQDSLEHQQFTKLLFGCQGFRRLGSAALNLCYLAAGRLDAYWALSLNLWDAAAGLLILQEAGGVIRHVDNREFDLDDPRFVAAATEDLYQEVLDVLN